MPDRLPGDTVEELSNMAVRGVVLYESRIFDACELKVKKATTRLLLLRVVGGVLLLTATFAAWWQHRHPAPPPAPAPVWDAIIDNLEEINGTLKTRQAEDDTTSARVDKFLEQVKKKQKL
jgi:hypothetical protein